MNSTQTYTSGLSAKGALLEETLLVLRLTELLPQTRIESEADLNACLNALREAISEALAEGGAIEII